jgi:hypothetical protein
MLTACLSLMGCALAVPVLDGAEQTVQLTRKKVRSMAGMSPTSDVPEPRTPIAVYCYNTLGDVDCFATPQEGQQTRLAGVGSVATIPSAALPITFEAAEEPMMMQPASVEPVMIRSLPPPPPAAKAATKSSHSVIIEDRVYDSQNLPGRGELEQKGAAKYSRDMQAAEAAENTGMWR